MATQSIRIKVNATEEVIDKWVDDYTEDCKKIGWHSEAENDGGVIVVTNWGDVKCYPSHSWYDPDEYEYDECFLGDWDEDIVLDWFKGTDIEVYTISIGDVEC